MIYKTNYKESKFQSGWNHTAWNKKIVKNTKKKRTKKVKKDDGSVESGGENIG